MEWVGVYSRLVGPFGGLVVQVFFFFWGGGMDGWEYTQDYGGDGKGDDTHIFHVFLS